MTTPVKIVRVVVVVVVVVVVGGTLSWTNKVFVEDATFLRKLLMQ